MVWLSSCLICLAFESGQRNMKNKLLGTTAIVTSAMALCVSPVQGAENLKIGVGGYFKVYVAAVNQDEGAGEPGENRHNHLIAREAEIHFNRRNSNSVRSSNAICFSPRECKEAINACRNQP